MSALRVSLFFFFLASFLLGSAYSFASPEVKITKSGIWTRKAKNKLTMNFEQSLQIREALEESFDVPRDKKNVNIKNIRCRVEALDSGYAEFVCELKKEALNFAIISGGVAQQLYTSLSEAGALRYRDLGNDIVEVKNLNCKALPDGQDYFEHKCKATSYKSRR